MTYFDEGPEKRRAIEPAPPPQRGLATRIVLEYFPSSAATYWLNYSVSHALTLGATPGDVADAVAPMRAYLTPHHAMLAMSHPMDADAQAADMVLPAAAALIAKGQRAWIDGWLRVAARLEHQAEADIEAGRSASAAGKLWRTAALLTIAEWSLTVGDQRTAIFDRLRQHVRGAVALSGRRHEWLAIPYEGRRLDALFFPASRGPAPAVIVFNGFHASMDWNVLTGLCDALQARGVGCLVFDHPGSGRARYHLDLPMTSRIEVAATAAFDVLAARPDVDRSRIASLGASFGGFYTVRAAAFEERLAACFAWGGWYCWPPEEVFEGGRRDGPPVTSVEMSSLDELFWVTGTRDRGALFDAITEFTLAGVVERLACPLVITHGANDRQVPIWHAHEVMRRAVSAPSQELHIFTSEEGGDQHCHLDNLPTARDFLCDRVAELLGGDDAAI